MRTDETIVVRQGVDSGPVCHQAGRIDYAGAARRRLRKRASSS